MAKRKKKANAPVSSPVVVHADEKKKDKKTYALESLAIVVGLLFWLLPKEEITIIFCLALVFTFLFFPLYNCSFLSSSLLRRTSTIVGVVSALFLIGYFVWPEGEYLKLSKKQREQFVAELRQVTKPKYIVRIGCSAPESVCAATTVLMDTIRDAGWIVGGNTVERGFLGRPKAGVTLIVHGEGRIPDNDNPKWGLWAVRSKEVETLTRAFSAIGVKQIETRANASLQEREILVVVGPEPKE